MSDSTETRGAVGFPLRITLGDNISGGASERLALAFSARCLKPSHKLALIYIANGGLSNTDEGLARLAGFLNVPMERAERIVDSLQMEGYIDA